MSTSARRWPTPQEPPRKMSWEEAAEKWHDLSPEKRIQLAGDRKWGWVVYRCAYAEKFDARWDEIKRQIVQDLHEQIAQSDAPDIADTMDFVFVEDPALEGASVAQMQQRFQAWAQATDGYNYVEGKYLSRGSRYDFFLMVDEDAFRNRYIGLVQGWPEPYEEDELDELDKNGPEDWVRLPADYSVSTNLYEELNEPEFWYTIYSPPESGEALVWGI